MTALLRALALASALLAPVAAVNALGPEAEAPLPPCDCTNCTPDELARWETTEAECAGED